jgi:hypothetical protein
MDWQALSLTQQDAQFLEQRRFSVEEICRWFGVPPQMIGDTSKQTFANFEQAGLNFLALAILPWVVRFEQEANRKLLAQSAGRRRPFLKINTAAIVRANLEAQYRAFALGRQWGWLSVNDIRWLIDMEPIGPEGDVYLQPMNMEPVSETPSRSTRIGAAQRRCGMRRKRWKMQSAESGKGLPQRQVSQLHDGAVASAIGVARASANADGSVYSNVQERSAGLLWI